MKELVICPAGPRELRARAFEAVEGAGVPFTRAAQVGVANQDHRACSLEDLKIGVVDSDQAALAQLNLEGTHLNRRAVLDTPYPQGWLTFHKLAHGDWLDARPGMRRASWGMPQWRRSNWTPARWRAANADLAAGLCLATDLLPGSYDHTPTPGVMPAILDDGVRTYEVCYEAQILADEIGRHPDRARAGIVGRPRVIVSLSLSYRGEPWRAASEQTPEEFGQCLRGGLEWGGADGAELWADVRSEASLEEFVRQVEAVRGLLVEHFGVAEGVAP